MVKLSLIVFELYALFSSSTHCSCMYRWKENPSHRGASALKNLMGRVDPPPTHSPFMYKRTRYNLDLFWSQENKSSLKKALYFQIFFLMQLPTCTLKYMALTAPPGGVGSIFFWNFIHSHDNNWCFKNRFEIPIISGVGH